MLAFEASAAIPVAVNNLTPTFYAVCVAICALFGIMARQWVPMKRLRIEENSGLRKEFIDEMHALRVEVSGLREDNGTLRKEVKGLRDENDLLRKEIREMHNVIDGLRRENQTAQVSGQRVIADALKGLPQPGKAQ